MRACYPMKTRLTVLAAVLALAGCERPGTEADINSLDEEIASNEADPALTSALEDQILVDPTLKQQSNLNSVRPAEGPVQAQYPTGTNPANAAAPICGDFSYGKSWSGKLPAPFALFPGAKVIDAAGRDEKGCFARVVTFNAPASADRLLGWYEQRLAGSGYSAERQRRDGDHVLAGTSDAGAYYMIVTPKRAGSEVALIVNTAR